MRVRGHAQQVSGRHIYQIASLLTKKGIWYSGGSDPFLGYDSVNKRCSSMFHQYLAVFHPSHEILNSGVLK